MTQEGPVRYLETCGFGEGQSLFPTALSWHPTVGAGDALGTIPRGNKEEPRKQDSDDVIIAVPKAIKRWKLNSLHLKPSALVSCYV